MSLNELKKTRSNILSSTRNDYVVGGSFDFFSTIVSLDSISNNDVENIKQAYKTTASLGSSSFNIDDFKKVVDNISLAIHEYTHYLDCTSTVWGINYLSLMMKAYASNTALYSDVTESEYHNAIKFTKHLKFIRLPQYYTLITEAKSKPKEWVYSESIGNRYDEFGFVSDHPILFMTFLNSNNEKLVRSPISTLSVLECSAMANEVVFKTNSVMDLKGNECFKVESKLYQESLNSYLYDKNLTEYSVCAHLVSSKLGITNTYDVFVSCSILCRMVLNATQEVFDKILECFDFSILFPGGGDNYKFAERIKKGISLGEIGILFYIICLVLKRMGVKRIDKKSVVNALSFMGVSEELYNKSIDCALMNHMQEALFSKEQIFVHLAGMGMLNNKEMRLFDNVIDFSKVITPPAYTSDAVAKYIFEASDSKFNIYYDNMTDIEELYDFMLTGQLWVENFSEAC